MKYQLSVCIPTYDRGNYIGETIESIIRQVDKKKPVQIVISDNASEDNTKQIVEKYQKEYAHIKYFCFSENQGADRNYLQSISLADGEYCLICGSDDAFKENAINAFYYDIDKIKADIYLYDRDECDINMNFLRERKWFEEKLSVNISSDDNPKSVSLIDYFDKSKSLGCVFSYITSIVFRKEQWDNYASCKYFLNSAYSHAYILLSILKNNGRFIYTNISYVNCRMENDSFVHKGIANRILIDFYGYIKLANYIFESNENKKLKAVLSEEHGLKSLIKFYYYGNKEQKKEGDNLFKKAKISNSKIYLAKAINFLGFDKLLILAHNFFIKK